MNEANRAVDTKGAVLAFNEGVAAAEAGDEAKAAAQWRRALEHDPGLLPAAMNLVTYYQSRGDIASELALWQLILDYDPFDTDHLVLQAAAHRRAGELERARDNYHRAITIYPYFKFWYHELAGIYEELGEPDEAALWRGRGDSLGADEAEICYEDGLRHVTEERWKSARTCFEAILDEFPANLDARLRLARVLERAGTSEEVVEQYETALDLTEAAKGLVRYRMGEFLVKQGALEEAERAFEAALASSSEYRKAERALAAVHAHRARQAAAAAPARPAEPAPSEPARREPARVEAAPPVEAARIEPAGRLEPAPRREPAPRHEPAPTAPPDGALLDPAAIGMEAIGGLVEFVSPTLRAPNPRLPWPQQIRQVLDQALSVAAPGGREPRVAVVVEPDRELLEAARSVLAELRSLGRSLRADANISHIFLARGLGDGELESGWLGRDEAADPRFAEWQRSRPGLPLNEALRAVREAGAEQGFNCLLIVGFGRCLDLDGETADLLATTPLHAVCVIRPGYHYVDLRMALSGEARNYIEIQV